MKTTITRLALLLILACGPAATLVAQSDDDRLARVKRWITLLNHEASQVEDIIAIHRIQRAYGYYVDKGYWREAADLFAAEATMEIGVDGIYQGRERILELLIRHGGGSPDTGPGLPFGQMNRHMQLQPVVSVNAAGDRARARWRDLSMLGQYHDYAAWGDAVMENEYTKTNGVWRIAAFRLYPNFVAPYEGGWAALEPVEGDWRSEVARDFPPDAPASMRYQPFPAVFVPPFHYPHPNEADAPASVFDAISAGDGPIGELEARVLALGEELENLKMEREIENLQAKYGYYIDKGMWDEAAALFSANASYEFGQRGVYQGRERIRQAIGLMGPEGLEQGMLNNYPMLQPIISVAGDNQSAKARWRSDVMLSRDGAGTWGGGVYENEYLREEGQWKISKLHYYVTFWADYDTPWNEGTIPMRGPSGEVPPDQPPTEVYAAQPEVYFFPFHFDHLVTGRPHPHPRNDAQEYQP